MFSLKWRLHVNKGLAKHNQQCPRCVTQVSGAKTLTQEWRSTFCQDNLDPGTREVRIHQTAAQLSSLNGWREIHWPLLFGQSMSSCFIQKRILSLAKELCPNPSLPLTSPAALWDGQGLQEEITQVWPSLSWHNVIIRLLYLVSKMFIVFPFFSS